MGNAEVGLREQLMAAAAEFVADNDISEMLSGIAADVERALAEPLEIFPVCHHSASSAIHMVHRLQRDPPKVIFMECCEDLQQLLPGLAECKLPVALQAFASTSDSFPADQMPLNLICPLTEFSAEFQAIAYAHHHPETELVFVDRSADHVFQWKRPGDDEPCEESDDEEAGMHGAALGVELGAMRLSFGRFREFLIRNARVQHFSEWWDQYVEEATIAEDYESYRGIYFLIGSLFRRLGSTEDHIEEDELRERYMWTRMKQYLDKHALAAGDALYICGAAHAASRVAEFGAASDLLWDIPDPTETKWLYGLLPSSHSAIEHQFAHPHGTLTMAQTRWKKHLRRQRLKPFGLKTKPPKPKFSSDPSTGRSVVDYLNAPPHPVEENRNELLGLCVKVVDRARRNGYLTSTADSIAIYQTAMLLARMRDRANPTAYDFRDAAITCIEKDVVPGKRDVAHICDIVLGGDRTGQVGYESLPPLARDVYDRLEGLSGVDLTSRTIQRALLDIRAKPELAIVSDLLWKLHYLLPDYAIRPIMGQMQLGYEPQQESWDLAIGKYQGAIIQLGYEGVTVEQVLESRLRQDAFGNSSSTLSALDAAEKSIVLLKSQRLTRDLGGRAIDLLTEELDASNAQAIFRQIQRLIHHFRSRGDLPAWCQSFVTTGYSHFAAMLPGGFADRAVKPEDLTGVLQYIFVLESLALSLGSDRSELLVAVKLSQAADPCKQALLWSAQVNLRLTEVGPIKDHLNDVMANSLTLPALPDYLSGTLLAIGFAPSMTALTVELMSRAFADLPDRVLMPWLPKLLMTLKPHASSSLPLLLKEAGSMYPARLSDLDRWQPPWLALRAEPAAKAPTQSAEVSARACAAAGLLHVHPETTNALASGQGLKLDWGEPPADGRGRYGDVIDLLEAYPDALAALSRE